MAEDNLSPFARTRLRDRRLAERWASATPADRMVAATRFLWGQTGTFTEVCELAFVLMDTDKRLDRARRLLRIAEHQIDCQADTLTQRQLIQQIALCTLLDDNVSVEYRFASALQILESIAPLDRLDDQDSLCLVGEVFKSEWQANGRTSALRQSLKFYRKDHAVAGPKHFLRVTPYGLKQVFRRQEQPRRGVFEFRCQVGRARREGNGAMRHRQGAERPSWDGESGDRAWHKRTRP
jgi:hypothetical protein